MPRISAIIPSYNHERYLAKAIASVLQQDVDDYEVILIDDASKDGSRKIIDEYRDDPRVRIEFHETNWGVSPVFNQGLELARGEYVAYLGSDDYWLPNHLAGALPLIDERRPAMIYGRAVVVNEDERDITEEFGLFDSVPDGEFFHALLQRPNFIPFISVVMRRDVARAVGGFDNRLVTLQDYDLWLRISAGHTVCFRDEVSVAFRWDGQNTSSPTPENRQRYVEEFTLIMDKLVREFAEELKNNDLENTFRRRLARQYRRMARRSPDPAERARLYRYSFDHVPRLHVARRYLMARLRAWYSAPRTKQPVNAEAG